MTQNLANNAHWALEQHKHMTKLRRKYWLLKVLMCLQVPFIMAYMLWLGSDLANFSSLSRNTQEGLVIAIVMTIVLAVAGNIVGMLKIEEARLEIKKEEGEMKL